MGHLGQHSAELAGIILIFLCLATVNIRVLRVWPGIFRLRTVLKKGKREKNKGREKEIYVAYLCMIR